MAESYQDAVWCHLWAAQFEYEAEGAPTVSSTRGACGGGLCAATLEMDAENKKLRKAHPKKRSKPIERAAQITLDQRLDMNDKPNLVAAFYQNAGNIHLSERDNMSAAECLQIGARALQQVDRTRAAIFYMESCNLILPPTADLTHVPPTAHEDFEEALNYMFEINKLALEPIRWLPEALSLLRRLCFILDHEKDTAQLFLWFLADVCVLLTLPDVESAAESLSTHEKHPGYRNSAEHTLASQLVHAFRCHDDKALMEVQMEIESTKLPIHDAVLRLVRNLNILRF